MREIKIIVPIHDKGKKVIVVDGEKYILDKSTESQIEDILHFTKLINEKDYETTVDSLADKISKKTDIKKIIKQALYQMPFEEFKKVKKEMDKEKPLVRNNEGCFFLSIGGARLQLRD